MSLNEVSHSQTRELKKNQDTHARQVTQVSSDTSSVWNFCVRSSDVISLGNQWCCHQMSAFPPATEDFSHLKANEGILNFKTAYPTSVYVFKIVLVAPGLTYASLACVQTSPLPQEKSIFPEGGGRSVHRLMPHLWLFYGF